MRDFLKLAPAAILAAGLLGGCSGRPERPEPRTPAEKRQCAADVAIYCATVDRLARTPLQSSDPAIAAEYARVLKLARYRCERTKHQCALTPGLIVERKS